MKVKHLLFLVVPLFFIPKTCPAQNVLDLKTEIKNFVLKESANLNDLYKYLHQHPELSFHEKETSARIAANLEQAGFEVTRHVGGYGVVGVMKNGNGPTVLVRTDMDALPIIEQTGLPYASNVRVKDDEGKEVGVMHACGHDIHMTVFTGVARALNHLKNHWHGTLVMIGQPAEEKGGGAKAMLADGLFTRFPRPDFGLALHDSPVLPAGTVGIAKGYALANVDAVDISIRGIGGHGAIPDATIDPVVIAARVVLALQTIVSREISPTDPAVVTVGSIHGGTKHNIIPAEVHLQLTLRSYSDKVRDQIIASIRRITRGIALSAGVPADKMPIVTVADEYTPATYNDPKLAEKIATVFKKYLGEKNVSISKPIMAGEDFGRYGRVEPRIPTLLFWLGAVNPDKFKRSQDTGEKLPSLHSSKFAPDYAPTIQCGVQAMTIAVLQLMGKK